MIVTDGIVQKRVLWLDVTTNGVYSGMCMEGRDMHTSYHADGNVFSNWINEEPRKIRTGPPLSNFKEWQNLVGIGFTSDLAKLHDTPLYKLKKLDAVIYVDNRVYKKGIGCNIHLIEPNRIDLIG